MRGFLIGRLKGIELRVDPSWLVIFVLLTWNLVRVFEHWHADWSPALVFAVALGASLLFFLCILLHEVAHSLVARRYGIEVSSITLFLFGGVSNIEREPSSAMSEFLMAIAGPITSIVLGIAAILLSSAGIPSYLEGVDQAQLAFSQLGPLTTLLAWLGPINVMIGVFNLIPGFPLDGGRILRSILWGITHDLHAATRRASAVGQAIGWLFIAGGFAMAFGATIPFFGTGIVSGIWLAFIGWFLRGAASQTSAKVALDDALGGMKVERLMRRDGPVVAPEDTIATVVHRHLLAGDDRGLPVVRDGELVGLVSVRDVRAIPSARWDSTSVASVMRGVQELRVVSPETPLDTAFEQLARHDFDQLPVVRDGQLVGMLRRRDVARWLELTWRPATGRGDRTGQARSFGHSSDHAHHPA